LDKKIKVLFTCNGIGIIQRGIESFFRESFDGLKSATELDLHLLKGRGKSSEDESVIWSLPRTTRLASLIGRATGRSAYAVEQWSTYFSVTKHIRKFKPDLIFSSDANLGFLLHRFCSKSIIPHKFLFSNGGPCHPPFDKFDYVQQITPYYYEEAVSYGEPEQKHFFVPYGINVSTDDFNPITARIAAREKLKLEKNRKVILSVGWISKEHKRMDYLIKEISALPEPRPFLQIVGAKDENTHELFRMAEIYLGPGNFAFSSVNYESVQYYYQAADCFVLASLKEGFGRVFLEALMFGLPTIAHRHPVMEYVLGDQGIIADLSTSGNLTTIISELLNDVNLNCPEDASRRRESVRSRFDWGEIKDLYVNMFRSCSISK